jgi:hypothetical protein
VDVKMQVVDKEVVREVDRAEVRAEVRGEVAAASVPALEGFACVPLAGTSCHTNRESPALR